ALIRLVARLPQLVVQVLQVDRLVVALDREDLLHHRFETFVLALLRGRSTPVVLQEALVAGRLNPREIGNLQRIATTTKAANIGGHESSLRRDSHRRATPNWGPRGPEYGR